MNNTKFTPGPWSACKDGDCSCHTISSEHFPIAATTGKDNAEDAPYVSEEERKANAKLIAAAPELLKALTSLVLSVMAHPDYTGEENEEWTDLIETAEEAIKKATE